MGGVCIDTGAIPASFVDPHTLVIRSEDGWRQVTARCIVIATGTRPAPTPGGET